MNDEAIRALAQSKGKIYAIKAYREKHQASLVTAKEAVEAALEESQAGSGGVADARNAPSSSSD